MKVIRILIVLSLFMIQQQLYAQELGIMTYNIRLDVASDGENAWPNRKEKLIDQILFHHPDVLGVQEATPSQMKDLKKYLKHYSSFGLGRDGGQEGEHSSIFYNSNRVKLKQNGTFWLSETPNKVSKGWDASLPRICTYGLFTIIDSDKKFWVFNTHLDHIGELARANSLKLILEKIASLNKENLSVILMGDFNLEPHSKAMVATFNKMADSRDLAEITHGPDDTFTGFNTTKPAERRIDYILLKNHKNFKIKSHATLAEMEDQRYPSDHFPVLIRIQYE